MLSHSMYSPSRNITLPFNGRRQHGTPEVSRESASARNEIRVSVQSSCDDASDLMTRQ